MPHRRPSRHRGDDFFAHFAERLDTLLVDQAAGEIAFHVLVEDGEVIGRFNLYDLQDGAAEVGYRVAERVTGRGVATVGLRRLCELARDAYGLRRLTAGTSRRNVASQKVLLGAGFVQVDAASSHDSTDGLHFERLLDRS